MATALHAAARNSFGLGEGDAGRELRRTGVSSVASARGALAALETIRPDVLLADLSGDGESAVALIERVRALPGGRERPSIVVTGRRGREERQRLLKAGFHQHMLNPVDPWELCRLVASLVERGS